MVSAIEELIEQIDDSEIKGKIWQAYNFAQNNDIHNYHSELKSIVKELDDDNLTRLWEEITALSNKLEEYRKSEEFVFYKSDKKFKRAGGNEVLEMLDTLKKIGKRMPDKEARDSFYRFLLAMKGLMSKRDQLDYDEHKYIEIITSNLTELISKIEFSKKVQPYVNKAIEEVTREKRRFERGRMYESGSMILLATALFSAATFVGEVEHIVLMSLGFVLIIMGEVKILAYG